MATYQVPGVPGATIEYAPAEARTGMFGGNSNWRGPVWLPTNYLVIQALVQYDRFFGPERMIEYRPDRVASCPWEGSPRTWPTGSSRSGCRTPTGDGR